MTRPSLFEEDIFQVARRIEAGEARAAYLDQVCGDDPALREQIDALLIAYDESQSFLESPASAMTGGVSSPPTLDEPLLDKPGEQIGPTSSTNRSATKPD